MKWAFGAVFGLFLLLLIPAMPIHADDVLIPEWVKVTVKLWSEDKITHEEFVNAIDYLLENKIIKLSGVLEEDVLREIEYLEAKNDVFKEELQKLRQENEEFRILLKSRDLTRDQLPPSLSKLFDENQRLQNEVRTLREINTQFTIQIDAWITNNRIPEQMLAGDSVSGNDQIKIEQYKERMNSLLEQNINYEKKVSELKNTQVFLQKKIDLLYAENENNKNLLNTMQERNQENRNAVNHFLQQKSVYENKILQLESENFDQQTLIQSYEEKFQKFDVDVKSLADENTQSDFLITQLQSKKNELQKKVDEFEVMNSNSDKLILSLNAMIFEYEDTIKRLEYEKNLFKNRINQMELEQEMLPNESILKELESEKNEQQKTLLSYKVQLDEANQLLNSLNNKIINYEALISSFENEKLQFKEKISKLELENKQQANTLISIMGKAEQSSSSVTSLSSELATYKGIIESLVEKNNQYENKIEKLEYTNEGQKQTLDTYMNNVVGSTQIVDSLNSKILNYEETVDELENKNIELQTFVTTLQEENDYYGNRITGLESESSNSLASLNIIQEQIIYNYKTIFLLKEENQNFDNEIKTLAGDNESLKNQLRFLSAGDLDHQININNLSAENENLKFDLEILQLQLDAKKVELAKILATDSPISSLTGETSRTLSLEISSLENQINDYHQQIDYLTGQNENYLIELNYLTAKSIVNEEEMQTLRYENEEYRVLINLLKKGSDMERTDDVKYSTIHDSDSSQGVIITKMFDDSTKKLDASELEKIDLEKEYLIYIQRHPIGTEDMSYLVYEAAEFWESVIDIKFRFIETSDRATAIISWHKELPNGYDGFVIYQKLVQIGLGNKDCDGIWHPYDMKSIRNILIHEIGHVLGLEHSNEQTNLMYPVIHNARFSSITETFSLAAGDAAFVGGCSLNPEPSYKFDVSVENSDGKIDLFFVTSKKEYFNFLDEKPFEYYSDPRCIGLNRSAQSGICENVSDRAGLLVIAPDSLSGDNLTVRVSIAER